MSLSALQSPLHRIPTLWSLFRPLLRATRLLPLDPLERSALEDYIRGDFKRSKRLGDLEKVKRKWLQAEQLLRQLEGSHHSSSHLGRTRELAQHLVARSSLPSHPPPPPVPNPNRRGRPAARAPKPSARPTILHATQFAPPMLRLRPQPIGTSMMIFNRRRKSQQRYDQLERAKSYVEQMRDEERFEARLGTGEREERWGREWAEWIKLARVKERREQERNNMRIPEELQAKARELNRQRERERRDSRRRTAQKRVTDEVEMLPRL